MAGPQQTGDTPIVSEKPLQDRQYSDGREKRTSLEKSWHQIPGYWLWEISSSLFAFALIGTIIGVLLRFDGKTLGDWRLRINLNTLISILADVLRASLLLIAAEIISQAKWGHFSSRPRRLADIQKFEDASRSVLGSITLLFVAPGNLLALFAALITILSLGIGPFVQQAAQTVPCPQVISGVNASIPTAQYMPGRVGYFSDGPGRYLITPELHGVLVNGLVNPTGKDSAIVANCTTGNCDFPKYGDEPGFTHSSIAMCSACVDTTRFVVQHISNGSTPNTLDLPNGLSLQPVTDLTHMDIMSRDNLSWATTAFTEDFTTAASISIQNITILSETSFNCSDKTAGHPACVNANAANHRQPPRWAVATSCALYPCIQNFHAKIRGGVLEETVVSSTPAPVDRLNSDIPLTDSNYMVVRGETYTNFTALQLPCIIDGTPYSAANLSSIPQTPGRNFSAIHFNGQTLTAPDECRYSMQWQYWMAMAAALDELFNYNCTASSRQGGNLKCDQGRAWWLPQLYHNGTATFDMYNATMTNFATTVTNHFRKTGGSRVDNATARLVLGTVLQETTCTRFEWKWLLLPIALVLVATALLGWMMVQVHRHPDLPIWKNSLLPLLFFGFRHPDEGPRQVVHMDVLNKRAGSTEVQIGKGIDAGFVDRSGWKGGA